MFQMLFSAPIRAGLLLTVAMAAGDCYASKYALGPRDKAKVDPAFCGKWLSQDGKTNVLIANFNDREYLVQVTGEDNKSTCYAGFIADVKGIHFAHLGPLTADGKTPEAWILQRVEVKDNQLITRDLNKEYFEGQNPGSADESKK